MNNDGTYPGGESENNWKVVVIDLPPWLEKAVEQKNPQVTLALAYSIPLEYDELDKKLMIISAQN
jgi:hypothetical protein